MDKRIAEYLGDGVYASFDGYMIWLAANRPENKVVALEPEVMAGLVRFADRVFKRGKGEE